MSFAQSLDLEAHLRLETARRRCHSANMEDLLELNSVNLINA